ncbi:MAG: AraC family transcriptional regulator [Planctomycetota bacterium]|jgi:AraC-like DNA-binding protein|nr:AraC family transcriptional regulator [Planctomycetota bacterium]
MIMLSVPPPPPADLAFLTVTTTGMATYSSSNLRTVRTTWHYWQFIYTFDGFGHGEIDGEAITAKPGTVWLLPRDRPHHYRRERGTNGTWRYRWIEFDGAAAPALIRMLALDRLPVIHGCQTIEPMLSEFLNAFDGVEQAHQVHVASARAIQILTAAAGCRDHAGRTTGAEARLVKRARRVLNDQLGTPTDLETVAASLRVSSGHLSRCFQRECGMSPMKYLAKLRADAAQRWLGGSDFSISQIGVMVGYPTPQHFSRMFRRETGLSPREYRRGIWRS